MDDYAADWLAQRAPYDAAARSAALIDAFIAALPLRATLIDLGAGTGAAPRALAAHLPAGTRWIGVDADARLLARYPGEARVADLAAVDLDALVQDADGLTAAAFLDIVSSDWMARFAAAARGRPVWCPSVVDDRRSWTPGDPEDAAVAAAFRADQSRDKGLGPALGPAAAGRFAQAFSPSHQVRAAAADWRLAAGDQAMLDAMIDAMARVAGADAWAARRRAQAAAGTLTHLVGHQDLLALPAAR